MREYLTKVDKTLRYYGAGIMRAGRRLIWNTWQYDADRPIFIVGCSRAGTTLVYKAFSESRELGTLDRETHDFWMDQHPLSEREWRSHVLTAADAGDRDRRRVARYFYSMTGRRRFVDKNNQNGLCVSYLHALFPDAAFVFVKRDPGDNINSLIEGWGKPEEFATWANDLPVEVAVDDARYTKWCFFLPDGWRDYTNSPIEDVCAFQYRSINESILEGKKEIPNSQWTEVFYEDLIRRPIEEFRRLFRDTNLAFDSDMEARCAKVLGKKYNAFSEIRVGKWKNGGNRARIERVLPTVSDVSRGMGYIGGN